eukprot:2171172-Rhodomonas_salina.2
MHQIVEWRIWSCLAENAAQFSAAMETFMWGHADAIVMLEPNRASAGILHPSLRKMCRASTTSPASLR